MTRRLHVEDFTEENWGSVAKSAIERHSPTWRFDPEYFFDQVRALMERDIAVTWGAEGAFLVGMFYRNLFSGKPAGTVLFWAADQSKESGALVRLFEAEGRARECESLHAGSYGPLRLEAMTRLYRKLGYVPDEVTYLKKPE